MEWIICLCSVVAAFVVGLLWGKKSFFRPFIEQQKKKIDEQFSGYIKELRQKAEEEETKIALRISQLSLSEEKEKSRVESAISELNLEIAALNKEKEMAVANLKEYESNAIGAKIRVLKNVRYKYEKELETLTDNYSRRKIEVEEAVRLVQERMNE